jgi:hypothetical protein
MNKKGISPLVSTVILIVLAIGIGIIVMNWGRAQLEAGSKCAVDTEMQFIKLNNVPQVCYSGSGENGFVKFIVENGANIDIGAVQIRIIGSKNVYNYEVPDSAMEKGFTIQKIVPYNFDLFGDVKQIRITPKVVVYPGEPSLSCPEQSIILEDIGEC